MKRLLAVALGICIVGSVLAQGSFTVVRPADGSKVREKVRVLIPKNSIDPGSYVGIFLNGKFIEAVVPPVEGNYRVYTLDTKGRQIPDGEVKLELVKYEGGDSPRIVDRSSVTVTVGNQMNISIPAGGMKLRYGFIPGQQLIYDVKEVVTTSTLSGTGNDNGSRAAQFPESELAFRMMYAVDNTYGNGDALVRMQNLPDKGKDFSVLAVVGNPDPIQVFDYQMQPLYMRVDKTARPIFGSLPEYFGFSSGSSPEGGEFAYGAWPLPVLPEKSVAPGSSWGGTFLLPVIAVDGDPHLLDKVAQAFPARGEFVDAEWELGHPCAKIRNSIAVGTRSFEGAQLAKAGKAFADDKVALDETIWFSLDTHKVLKLVRAITIDHKEIVQEQPSGGQGGRMGGPSGGNMPGMQGGGIGTAGAGAGTTKGEIRPGMYQGRPGGMKGGGAVPPPGVPGGGFRGGGGPMGQQGGRTGGSVTSRTQFIRQVFEQIFTLEQ